MAYAPHRSARADLHQGMTDGAWKKAYMNRGGWPELTSLPERRLMSGVWHGFNESEVKVLPDGRVCTTRDYQSVCPHDMENV